MIRRRRIRDLEEVLHAGDETRMSEQERDFLCWLSKPSVLHVLQDFAELRARRRYLWETGQDGDEILPSGVVRFGSSGWYRLSDKDHHDRILAEIEAFEALRTDHDDNNMLMRRLDRPDDEHWPSLLEPTDRLAFDQRLRYERQMIDGHQGDTGKLGIIWRCHHPAWQPGMPDEAYDAFEVLLCTTAAQW
jgi:hypothetical protein